MNLPFCNEVMHSNHNGKSFLVINSGTIQVAKTTVIKEKASSLIFVSWYYCGVIIPFFMANNTSPILELTPNFSNKLSR